MKKLFQGAISTTGTNAYTCPVNATAQIRDIEIANTTAGTITITLYDVLKDASPIADNMIFPSVSLLGNSLLQWTGELNMTAGEYIQCIGGLAGITITINGEEIRR